MRTYLCRFDAPPGFVGTDGRRTEEGGPTRCDQTRPTEMFELPYMEPGSRRLAEEKL